jgi:hypothetical protein
MKIRLLADFSWFWQKNRTIAAKAYCLNCPNFVGAR